MYGVGYPVMDKAIAGHYVLWFLIVLAAGKIIACSMTLGIGGSGGVFAPSLFIGVTSGMAFGEIAGHVFGPGAGQPALYAVVAMGAVFTSAARAPLTSLASVVELTGDFTLTLPVMLAVAIASIVSRMLSYGTIYTTKLLRRGIDVDRAAPWRAFGDLKVREAMQPLGTPLPIPEEPPGQGDGQQPDLASLPGPVTHRRDPQILFSNESVAQALRQLDVYGHDGLPVLSPDGQQILGWVTSAGVLRAIAGQIDASRRQAPKASSRPAGPSVTRSQPCARPLRRCPAIRSSKSPSRTAPPQSGSRWEPSPGRTDGRRFGGPGRPARQSGPGAHSPRRGPDQPACPRPPGRRSPRRRYGPGSWPPAGRGSGQRRSYGSVTRGEPTVRRRPRRGAHGWIGGSPPILPHRRSGPWASADGWQRAVARWPPRSACSARARRPAPARRHRWSATPTSTATPPPRQYRSTGSPGTPTARSPRSPGSPFAAGGAGLGTGLASQGAIQATPDGRYLLAVDAGSNQISVLRITAGGVPVPVGQPVSSGGIKPVSVAVSPSGLVYVANQGNGGGSGYSGFRLHLRRQPDRRSPARRSPSRTAPAWATCSSTPSATTSSAPAPAPR